jgi:hypothetical protein
VLGWLAVPAWSLRVARWLRKEGQRDAGRAVAVDEQDGQRVGRRDDQPAA